MQSSASLAFNGSRRPRPGRRRRESEAGGRQLTKILTAAAAEIVEPEKELGRPWLRAAASKTAAARQWFEFCKQRPVLGTDRFAQNARFCVGSLRPTTGGFLKSQLLRDRREDESTGTAGKRSLEKVLEVNVCTSREVRLYELGLTFTWSCGKTSLSYCYLLTKKLYCLS